MSSKVDTTSEKGGGEKGGGGRKKLSGRTVILSVPKEVGCHECANIEVPEEIACMSGLIAQFHVDREDNEEEGSSGDEEKETYPLPNLTEPILRKCLVFMREFYEVGLPDIPMPLDDGKTFEEQAGEFASNFIKCKEAKNPIQRVFDIILGACYLKVEALQNIACAYIAFQIKGKTREEIAKVFGVTEDFTPAEELKVREENAWLEANDDDDGESKKP